MRRSILSCLLPSRVLAACSAPPARDAATAAPSALPPVQHPADKLNTRPTPSLYNLGCQTAWYWDGRATTLEGQVSAAWRAQIGADPAKVAAWLNGVPGYRSRFEAVFGSEATPQNEALLESLTSTEPWQAPSLP